MDFRLFELLNGSLRGHAELDRLVSSFADWSVPLFAAATIGLWFLARPGGSPRWKIAAISALAAAGLGLLANQVIGRLWFRERPYEAHPGSTVLLAHPSKDPSFPSDHATAAFAIAFAVLAFSLRVGLAFLVGASLIAVSRVFVGLHYPGDVAAGALIGLLSALIVTTLARDPVTRVAALGARVTDPLLRLLTTRFAGARRSRRR